MDSETLMVYGIPTVTFLVSSTVTYFLGNRAVHGGLKFFSLSWLALCILLIIGLVTATGWDGLIFAAALIGIMAPAGVGGLIGGWIGKATRANELQIGTS